MPTGSGADVVDSVVRSAGARSSRRRAAIRDRVNWTAAAGRGVVASNADSGNNISTASVVGATVGAIPIPATTAPSTLAPIAAVGIASAMAAGLAAASRASPQARWRRCDSAMTPGSAPATRSSGACSSAIIAAVSRSE